MTRVLYDIEAAADGNEDLRLVLERLTQQAQQQSTQSGLTTPVLPDKAQLAVSGVDGTFIIQITNPGDIDPATIQQRVADSVTDGITGQTLFHQVQSATGPNFDAAASVTTYPTTSNTRLDITDPNKTYYWRMRSSFDQQNWNDWTYLSSAAVCGVVPVWSGLMRPVAVMPSATNKDTNFATVDSLANGGTCKIRVYGVSGPGTSWTGQRGSSTVGPYPSGSISGLLYNTKYIVMYQPPDPVTGLGEQFTAVTTLPPTLSDTLVYVGTVLTLPAGGTAVATGDPIFSGDPAPTKVITGVNITNPGAGYSSPPDVQFNGDATGTGAAATAVINASGQVTGVVMTNQGSGYTGNGTVDFVGGQSGVTGGGGTDGGTDGRYGNVDLL